MVCITFTIFKFLLAFLITTPETFRRQKDEVPEIVDVCLTWLEKNGIIFLIKL